MNYDLTGGNPKKPMPIMDNFVRDDWGGNGANSDGNPSEVNGSQDVNGSDNKPFPQERNFKMDASALIENIGAGHEAIPQTDHNNVGNRFGQVKYAKREGATSIYKDETRNTANDAEASAKTEGSTVCDTYEENTDEGEAQGGQ